MVRVVVGAPLCGEKPRLGEGRELLDVEDLVAEPSVERLDPGVLPGRARIDVGGQGRLGLAPLAQDAGGELGAVVGAQVLGRAAFCDEAFQRCDCLVGVDRALDLDPPALRG